MSRSARSGMAGALIGMLLALVGLSAPALAQVDDEHIQILDVTEDADGRLSFGEPLERIAEDLGRLLRPRVRNTLQNFAGAATTAPARAAGPSGASVGRSVELG